LLLELGMSGSTLQDKPKLSRSVKTLFTGKFPRWRPLDVFRSVTTTIPNIVDFGGYEESVAQGTYLALEVNTYQLFVQFGMINVAPKDVQNSFEGELTESQREAYETLAHFLDLKLNPRTAGGIRPRPHALIIGPSGVGKTALVRAFA